MNKGVTVLCDTLFFFCFFYIQKSIIMPQSIFTTYILDVLINTALFFIYQKNIMVLLINKYIAHA